MDDQRMDDRQDVMDDQRMDDRQDVMDDQRMDDRCALSFSLPISQV
jgi:hypothetical protein